MAAGPLVTVGDLPAAVAERLGRLPPPARAGAELVALSEPVGAAIVEQLVSPEVRARLDDERVLSAVPDRRRAQLRLVHPLYTEALRATVPPLRARDHARRLAETLTATGLRRKEDRLRVALWHLAAGRRDRPDLYLAACNDARAAQDHDLAAQLAQAAVDGGGGLQAELALLQQLPYQDRLAEALERAEALAGVVTDAPDVVEVSIVRARLHVVAGDLEAAERVLRAAQTAARTPELRGRVLAQFGEAVHESGDVTRSTEVIDESLTGEALDPDALVAVAPDGVRALAVAGRPEDAVALADRALDAIDEGAAATVAVRDSIAMAQCQAVAYTGRVDLALVSAQAGAAASRGGPRALWLIDVGQALLLTGRPRGGLVALREMMAELPLAGTGATVVMWSLDAMAEASALLGDLEAARQHLDELARRSPAGFSPPRTGGAAWTAAAGGELRRARDIARAAAVEHAERGAAVPQAQALYDVARLGDPADVVAELERLASDCQGDFVPALARAARGLAERDADALDAGAREFESQGLELMAAELATESGALHRRHGRRGAAWAAARRAADLASRCEGARTPLLTDREDAGGLTEREWEVASLVARGLSDREVAERLQLSVRTVHSHLHRTYRKLGISSRDELTHLLG